MLPGTRAMMAILVPATTWMMLDQIKFVADQNFASRLPPGDLAALNYAFQIVQVVVSVTGGAYLTAVFPRLSDLVAAGNGVIDASTRATERVVVFAALPAALLLGGAAPVVTVLLERGAFGREATAGTSNALFWFAPGVLFISINMLLKTLLFLGKRSAPMLWVGLLELGLNVALNALLIGPMGIGGLALATSVTTLVVMVGLPFHLRRAGLLDPGAFFSVIARVLVPAVAAALAAWATARLVGGRGFVLVGLGLGLSWAAGALVFWGLSRWTGLSIDIPFRLLRGATARRGRSGDAEPEGDEPTGSSPGGESR
jgi:putative peptidoglycan lipid II flippase